jgi:hypothetical protein
MLNSYDTVVSERIAIGVTEQIVPSVLKHFDLPDVVAAIAPRQVILSGNVNTVGREITPASVRKEYARAITAYSSGGAPNAFRIVSRNDEEESLPQALRKWQH